MAPTFTSALGKTLGEALSERYVDPVTGDALGLGEVASWHVQGVMRRWTFLLALSALTALVWVILDPIWRHPPTEQWNLWASYLAIMIEGVTAMALINQSRRDAVVIREIRALAQQMSQLLAAVVQDVERIESEVGQDTVEDEEEGDQP